MFLDLRVRERRGERNINAREIHVLVASRMHPDWE